MFPKRLFFIYVFHLQPQSFNNIWIHFWFFEKLFWYHLQIPDWKLVCTLKQTNYEENLLKMKVLLRMMDYLSQKSLQLFEIHLTLFLFSFVEVNQYNSKFLRSILLGRQKSSVLVMINNWKCSQMLVCHKYLNADVFQIFKWLEIVDNIFKSQFSIIINHVTIS